MRFLIESYNFVGDIMRDIPLFRVIAKHGHHVEVIVGERVSSMLADCSFIETVHVKNSSWTARLKTYMDATRKGRCDVILGTRRYPRFRLLKLCGRVKIWRDESNMLSSRYGEGAILYRLSMLEGLVEDWEVDVDTSLPLLPIRYERAYNAAELQPEDTYLAVSPGASTAVKRWPLPKFAEVIRRLSHNYTSIIIVGSPEEQNICTELAAHAPNSRSMAGKLGLLETCAIVSRATQYVGNDSGLGHVAAGNGVPVVAIGGSEDGYHTPWRQHMISRELSEIDPEHVLAALSRRI